MRIYDISTKISPEMPVYTEQEKVRFEEIYQLKNGNPCNLTRISLTGHTGSHADMPLHFMEGGESCDTVALEHFYGRARVVHMPPGQGICRKDVEALELNEGDIILLSVGGAPLLPEAAECLAETGIRTLGVDSLSVDPSDSKDFPSHKILLGKGIPIIEGLELNHVPQGTYGFSALPLKIENGNGSPVRAVLSDECKVELVIFDMDGLMIDTEPISKRGWQNALKEYGLELDDEIFARLLGTQIKTAEKIMCAHYGKDFDFKTARAKRKAYVDEYINKHGVEMKPGLIEMLDRLDALGIKKCVATSTERPGMEDRLGKLGILERFDGHMTGSEVTEGKPNPEIFLKAAKKMGVPPENCIVLEDSLNGIAAAYAAGMRPIMVPDLVPPDRRTLGRLFAQCGSLVEAVEVISTLTPNEYS